MNKKYGLLGAFLCTTFSAMGMLTYEELKKEGNRFLQGRGYRSFFCLIHSKEDTDNKITEFDALALFTNDKEGDSVLHFGFSSASPRTIIIKEAHTDMDVETIEDHDVREFYTLCGRAQPCVFKEEKTDFWDRLIRVRKVNDLLVSDAPSYELPIGSYDRLEQQSEWDIGNAFFNLQPDTPPSCDAVNFQSTLEIGRMRYPIGSVEGCLRRRRDECDLPPVDLYFFLCRGFVLARYGWAEDVTMHIRTLDDRGSDFDAEISYKDYAPQKVVVTRRIAGDIETIDDLFKAVKRAKEGRVLCA